MTKNIGKVDHVVISVLPENYDRCVDALSHIFGVDFPPPCIRDDLNVKATWSYDAGLEVLTVLRKEGPRWEHLERSGEGVSAVIVGVDNLDEARERAAAQGFDAQGTEIGLNGDEPWAQRFRVVRELGLGALFGANLMLGEIETKD